MRATDAFEYVGKPLWDVLQSVRSGRFGPPSEMNPLLDSLTFRNDFYLVAHDFYDYAKSQLKVNGFNFWIVKSNYKRLTKCTKAKEIGQEQDF